MRQTLRFGIGLLTLVFWIAPVAAEAETIYAVTSTNLLLTFDSATPGTTTSVAITGLQAGENVLGIDLRPATGQLYALGSTSRLYTINPVTGAATLSHGNLDGSGRWSGAGADPVGLGPGGLVLLLGSLGYFLARRGP